jgi:hypothetical protein
MTPSRQTLSQKVRASLMAAEPGTCSVHSEVMVPCNYIFAFWSLS